MSNQTKPSIVNDSRLPRYSPFGPYRIDRTGIDEDGRHDGSGVDELERIVSFIVSAAPAS